MRRKNVNVGKSEAVEWCSQTWYREFTNRRNLSSGTLTNQEGGTINSINTIILPHDANSEVLRDQCGDDVSSQ